MELAKIIKFFLQFSHSAHSTLIPKGKKFEVVKQLKHDPHAFLEGLAYYNGYIYESTGLKGQ